MRFQPYDKVIDTFPYEIHFTPRTYECGPGGYMKPHSLMQQIQEAAAKHAEVLGVGMDWMMRNGTMWALLNFRIDLGSLPLWEKEVTLFTWPSGHDGMLAFREFSARDEDGRELFKASSDWIVLDVKRKMPVLLKDLKVAIPDSGKRNFGKLMRLKEVPGYEGIHAISVGRGSIDMNGHVNNTEYIRWGIDALSRAGTAPERISSMSITYSHEVFEKDEIDIGHVLVDRTHHLRGVRKDRTVFVMECDQG